ncbi:hypothetical protein LCGC14_1118840 [marine sediment metagenome]|uniref:Uncharacterized protein n=1 Tax=marine sediment metagenome TaxID=412755 RepID=A0A0F9M9F4_9ZZZZ
MKYKSFCKRCKKIRRINQRGECIFCSFVRANDGTITLKQNDLEKIEEYKLAG